MILASALSLSPESSIIISPTTKSSESISTSLLSRKTLTFTFIMLDKLSAFFSAFHSCTAPNIKSTNIINEIAIASVFSPTIKEKTTVITNNKTIGSNIPIKKILIKLSFFFLGKIFLPFSNNLF